MQSLEDLRGQYTRLTTRPFKHFYCPILFRDEDVELCQGHVVNAAFPGSDRTTVLQRTDVDSFFGSRFEADFVLLAERGLHDPVDVLLDPKLRRKLRPRLTLDGQPVAHYSPRGAVPPVHSQLAVERPGGLSVPLALKLTPTETLSSMDGKWDLVIEKDIRLAALVSLLKAAHLSLFSLLGYSYALSAGGRFVGWDVLGQFVVNNITADRTSVLANAATHFAEFTSLVRPMLSWPEYVHGTVTDNELFLCTGSPKPWAFAVFVRTGSDMHAVLVPILEEEEGAARFARHLAEPSPRFEVKRARLVGDRWEVAKDSRIIDWPAAGFDPRGVESADLAKPLG